MHLNGRRTPEIETTAATASPLPADLFVGGHSNNHSNWEGRLDEVAVFDRTLSAEEVAKLTPNDP